MKYIGVCGSREFQNKEILFKVIDELKKTYQYITLVSGGARGADKLAEQYAKQNKINIIIYEADWSKGKHAGFERNHLIAEKCDILIACFKKGLPCNGTKHTVNLTVALNKEVIYLLSNT